VTETEFQASASPASDVARKALSIAESNTAAIDALNAKIDQRFNRRLSNEPNRVVREPSEQHRPQRRPLLSGTPK